jgi:hypothetical protein
MRDHHWRFNPFEAEAVERERPQKWRGERERMNRRADVMDEAGQRELSGATASADGLGRFEHDDLVASLRQDNRRR